jgi:hypothetical protein
MSVLSTQAGVDLPILLSASCLPPARQTVAQDRQDASESSGSSETTQSTSRGAIGHYDFSQVGN